MTLKRKETGRIGEEAAAGYLSGLGYITLRRNYSCPIGEIDIIAREGDTIVFVEVRARTGDGFGLPQESINLTKRHKLRQLAWYYLKATGQTGADCRFDAVAVMLDYRTGAIKEIEHLPDAF